MNKILVLGILLISSSFMSHVARDYSIKYEIQATEVSPEQPEYQNLERYAEEERRLISKAISQDGIISVCRDGKTYSSVPEAIDGAKVKHDGKAYIVDITSTKSGIYIPSCDPIWQSSNYQIGVFIIGTGLIIHQIYG